MSPLLVPSMYQEQLLRSKILRPLRRVITDNIGKNAFPFPSRKIWRRPWVEGSLSHLNNICHCVVAETIIMAYAVHKYIGMSKHAVIPNLFFSILKGTGVSFIIFSDTIYIVYISAYAFYWYASITSHLMPLLSTISPFVTLEVGDGNFSESTPYWNNVSTFCDFSTVLMKFNPLRVLSPLLAR